MKCQSLVILVCLTFMVVLPTASMGGVWRDNFDGAKIGSGWEFTNPPKQCKYEVADGMFSIKLEGKNDIWGGQDNAAKLLREAPEGNYSVETRIVIKPDAKAKTANTWTSITMFDDAKSPSANWLYLARGGNSEINIEYAKNNAGNIGPSLKNMADTELYLKVEKTGQDYTGHYKIKENDKWIKVGTTKHDALNPSKVGLLVKSWAVRSMVCNYDYFEMEGENVKSNMTAVAPNGKLAVTWGQLRSH